jgi:hypothetical protein
VIAGFVRRDGPDAAHEAAAIRADGERFVRGLRLRLGTLRRGFAVGLVKQVAHVREGVASVAFGEEAVVTDAVEAVGQDVEEKAADELVRGKPHDAASASAAIVLVRERHMIVVDGDEPRVGDRRAVRVAGEIGQYALASTAGNPSESTAARI